MSDDLAGHGVARLSALLEARAISPVELADSCLDRIERLDRLLAAFVAVDPGRVRAEAKEAEREIARDGRRGPLHGIPFAVKDIFDVAGYCTTAGSRTAADGVATRDASCVARLRAAGAVMLGKAATYEFATGGPSFDLPWPPTRNPWNLDHGPGGSSTGSAAAVAAGMAPFALGTDTGGSVRVPASYCGLTGLKPGFGRIGVDGIRELAPSLDTVGLLCRSAVDAALVLHATAGGDAGATDEAAPPGGDLRGARIGVVRAFFDAAHAETVAAANAAEAVLRGLGTEIGDATLPPLAEFGACQRVIVGAEAFAIHRAGLARDAGAFGEVFRYRVLPGMLVSESDYAAANALRRRLTAATLAALEPFDALLTPTTLGPAPAFAATALGGRLAPFPTAPFSVARVPAIAVCSGFAASGLPLSLQIAGRPDDEATVLRIADAYQRATSWNARRPPLDAARPAPASRTPDWMPADVAPDPALDARIDDGLRRHAIRLTDRQRLQLREGGGALLAMTARLRERVES